MKAIILSIMRYLLKGYPLLLEFFLVHIFFLPLSFASVSSKCNYGVLWLIFQRIRAVQVFSINGLEKKLQ